MPTEGISIILPVHNEADSLRTVIEGIRREFQGLPHEIIAVDDGSTDGSFDTLAGLSQDGLVLIRHKRNKGYGFALKSGIRRAAYPNLLIVDADGSYPLGRLREIAGGLREFDMVVGSRKLMLNLRTPARWFIRKLAEVLTGERIPDLNSGMRAMRKAETERFTHLLPDGFSFTSTLTMAMFSNGLDVKYVPV